MGRKKGFILKSLDARVESAIDLKKVVEKISLEDSEEEVSAKLADCFEKQKQRFPAETINNFERYKAINKESEELNEQISEIYEKHQAEDEETDYYGLNEDEELHILEAKQEKLYTEQMPLSEDLNIEFLMKFERTANDLSGKNKYIKNVLAGGGEEKFKKDFLPRANETHDEENDHIEKGDIKKVIVEPFDVIFDIGRKSKVVGGRYYSGTPFISVFEASSQHKDFVINHERMHNVLNAVEIGHHAGRGFEKFERSYAKYREYVDSDTYKPIVGRQIKTLKKFNQFDFIDEHHEEIAAAIEEASAREFKSTEAWLLQNIFGTEDEKLNFSTRAGVLATAGNRFIENDKKLTSMARQESDPKMKELIENLKVRFEAGVINTIDYIKEAIDIARVIGLKAEEELYILFMMLSPTKYRHIKPYFENHYGKENIEKKVRNYELVNNPDFSYLQIKEIAEKIKSGEIILNEEDKKSLSEELENFDVGDRFHSLGINTLDEVNGYIDAVKKFAKILGVKKLPEDFENRANAQFFYNILKDYSANQFQDFPEFYEKLNAKQKKEFKIIIEDYISNFIEDDLIDNGVEISSIEEIKKLPLWSAIQKIGLEKKASKVIKEMLKRQAEWDKKQKEKE